MVDINRELMLIMFWIVIHLGKNPRKGGNPPNDMKFTMNIIFIISLVFIELKS